MHLLSLAGKEAQLARLTPGGILQETDLFKALDQAIASRAPSVVVLDTLADLFPGNENDRAQARQFVGMLRGLAMGLIYRNQLFPRRVFGDMFAVLLEQTDEKTACRMTVDLLALAVEPAVRLRRNDRGCEAELAAQLEEDLCQKRLPDMAALWTATRS